MRGSDEVRPSHSKENSQVHVSEQSPRPGVVNKTEAELGVSVNYVGEHEIVTCAVRWPIVGAVCSSSCNGRVQACEGDTLSEWKPSELSRRKR